MLEILPTNPPLEGGIFTWGKGVEKLWVGCGYAVFLWIEVCMQNDTNILIFQCG